MAWQVAVQHHGILILPQPLEVARMAQVLEELLQAELVLDNELYEWRASTGWTLSQMAA